MSSYNNLQGKVALVTAAAQGIGRTSAELLASHGAKVYAVDINEAELQKVKNCTPLVCDLTDLNSITALAQEVGSIDILFNCAGFVHAGTILDCDEKSWEFSFNLNVKSMYRLIRAFLPDMVERKSGNIINMSSVASSITGAAGRFVYGASKAAVIGLTKSVATDFINDGIRCNAICPGTIETPSLHERLADTGDYDKAYRDFSARQPMGRLGTAEEVASLALYLASDATFTTGQTHTIDGGWTI